jgi:hypothetical protein
VRCPEVSSGKARPLRVIPKRGQVAENSSDRRSVPAFALPAEEGGHVLHEDVAGSKLANDSGEVGPKTRAGSIDARPASGSGEVLAREPAADEIDRRQGAGADLADVGESPGARESVGEDFPTPRVDLDLPLDFEAGPMKPEVESPDPCEEAADIHPPPPARASASPKIGR